MTKSAPEQSIYWRLLPFKAAIDAGIPAIMVSNATVPGLSSMPASVSHTVVTGLLRHRLGFGGLVMSDSLSAHALGDADYRLGRAVVQPLRAGDDLIVFGSSQQLGPVLTRRASAAITTAVESGALPKRRLLAAVASVLQVKQTDLCRTG